MVQTVTPLDEFGYAARRVLESLPGLHAQRKAESEKRDVAIAKIKSLDEAIARAEALHPDARHAVSVGCAVMPWRGK